MNSKKKILFVTHLFHPAVGGVEIHIKHLSAALVKRGYAVNVLTTNAYSTEAFFMGDKRRVKKQEETIDGVHVHRVGFKTFGSRLLNKICILACRLKFPFNRWVRFYSFGPRSPQFIHEIVVQDPDIIITVPLPTLNVHYAYKAAKQLNKPLIIIPSYHIADRCCFYNPLFFKMLREADLVVPHTSMEKDFLAAEAGVDPNRMAVMPPFPLTEDQLEPELKNKFEIRQKYKVREKYVVLYLGQHGIHKKVNRVLEAMPYVWQRFSDTALVIAGGVTDNTRLLKKKAAALNRANIGKYEGRVYFIENFYPHEKNDILQMSDVFISLSEMESFGIVFVEAMNNGIPMIASRNCVSRDIVKETETGILVEPKSITDVAGGIMELLGDEAMRKRFGQNGRKNAVSDYHPQHLLARWEELFANVIKPK